jgi:ferredoxin-nitrite reductase
MNWSACPKGCGVHGIGDIGFEGCKAKDEAGNRVDGVHIFLGGKITREAREAHILHKTLPITEAKHHVKYLLKTYRDFKKRGESFEAFEDRYLSRSYSYQALGFYTRINYILNEKLGLNLTLDLEKEPRTYKKEDLEIFDFGMKLFRLLTGEKRYEAVENFEVIKTDYRRIKRNEVTRLNPKVPEKLSEIIYQMTDYDKMKRMQVFTEALVALKEV